MRGNMNIEAMEALFGRVLNNVEGRRVIMLLRGFIDSHPKTDLDYARAMGMHRIVDLMMDYADILQENNNGN